MCTGNERAKAEVWHSISIHCELKLKGRPLALHVVVSLWARLQVYDNDEDVDKEATLRLPRDTKNPTAFDKERRLGSYRTTQSMAFTPPPEVRHKRLCMQCC